jgi:hypothetical protein
LLRTDTISLPRQPGNKSVKNDVSFFAFLCVFSFLCVHLCGHFLHFCVHFFLHFLLSGAVCVVDLSDIENIGDNRNGESYNIGNKHYSSKTLIVLSIIQILMISSTPYAAVEYCCIRSRTDHKNSTAA